MSAEHRISLMAPQDFISQFGETLINPSEERSLIEPSHALADKDFIMLYFSAHWCPPCRLFTPELMKTYKTLVEKSKRVELVFCSLDNEEKDWEEYTADMPWLCMPFGSEQSQEMAEKYEADGIPHLVIIDGESGQVITTEGTEEVRSDPEGINFPWKPKKLSEVWPASLLPSKDSGMESLESSTLNDKYLMLYFSAHWCPPCQVFTPVLSEAYKTLKQERDDFELIFVSSDSDEESFKTYFSEMSFCALPYEHRDTKKVLSKMYNISGIPSLLMLGPVCNEETLERPIINKNIRGSIEDGDLSQFPFPETNYGNVDSAQDIDEVKAVIVFHEAGDDDEHQKIKDLLKTVAKEREHDKTVKFFWALSSDGLGPRIRTLTKMSEVPSEPEMIMLDIPDNGGYYKSDVSEITVDNVMKFIESPGERHQLE